MTFRRFLWALLALFLVIQIFPSNRSNPPVKSDIVAPTPVKAILKRACYDCHSNETHWPWYSSVAPMSWLVAYDVNEAREHFNFSTWGDYDEGEQRDHLEEAWEEIEDGNMPLWYYLPLHPAARLDAKEKKSLRTWILSQTDS
jgi:hypothetical protein